MGFPDELFVIHIFDPNCSECCCNDCGTEFSWDRTTHPSCPACSSKDIRSA